VHAVGAVLDPVELLRELPLELDLDIDPCGPLLELDSKRSSVRTDPINL